MKKSDIQKLVSALNTLQIGDLSADACDIVFKVRNKLQEALEKDSLQEGDKVKLKLEGCEEEVLTYRYDVDEKLSRVEYPNGDQLDCNKNDLVRLD